MPARKKGLKPMPKATVLLVEDDHEIRDQMRWGLEDSYTLHVAGNAREALALMKRERPPLVTLDLGLPPHAAEAVEGLAVLEGLLAIDRFAKVIVITGNNDRANALGAIQRGAYDYM